MSENKIKDLFGNIDEEMMYQSALRVPLDEKIQMAIDLIRTFELQALALSQEGYYVCFSGGKDSIVLAKLYEMAGVRHTLNYNNVTIDPPELVKFIKARYPDVIWHNSGKGSLPMHMKEKSCGPPTRMSRWCCEIYKEQGGGGGDLRLLVSERQRVHAEKGHGVRLQHTEPIKPRSCVRSSTGLNQISGHLSESSKCLTAHFMTKATSVWGA